MRSLGSPLDGAGAVAGGGRNPPGCVRRCVAARAGRGHQEPRRTPERPRDRGGESPWHARPRGARARLAVGLERVRRGDRDQRQDDDDRVDRPRPPRPRPAGRGRRQRRHRCLAAGEHDAETTVVCEASSFQLEDTVAVRARGGGAAEPCAGPPRPPRDLEDYVAAKLKIFANQGNDDLAVAPADLDVEDLGGCAPGRVAAGRVRRAPQLELSARRLAVVGRRAADRRRRDRAAGRAQPRQRDGDRGGLPGPRDRARRGRRACGRSPASHTAWRRSRSARRRVRQRLQGDQRRVHARRARELRRRRAPDLGGRGKNQDFSAWPSRWRSAARRST